MEWATAVVVASFFLGMFWFLGQTLSPSKRGAGNDAFWAYKTAEQTAQSPLLTEMSELREDVRALRSQVDELHRILQAVE